MMERMFRLVLQKCTFIRFNHQYQWKLERDIVGAKPVETLSGTKFQGAIVVAPQSFHKPAGARKL